jgi:hypothetical protein
MKLNATPENTAVVTILAYPIGKAPASTQFLVRTAEKFDIKIIAFGKGEEYSDASKSSLDAKTIRLNKWIGRLETKFEYVLYVDARDVIFTRPLKDICDEFNSIGSPILMSAEPWAYPHCHPDWEKRHPQFPSGFNYPNAGCFMGHRQSIMNALAVGEHLSYLIRDSKIFEVPQHFWNDDQIMWQIAYVLGLIPMRVDHENRIFNTVTNTRFDLYDFSQTTKETPLVMTNGSKPCVMHFPGGGCCALPFAAWSLGLIKKPFEL